MFLLCQHCMEKKFHFCAGGSEVNVFLAAPDSNCQVNDYARIYIYIFIYIYINICDICMYDMYYCVCTIRKLVRGMLMASVLCRQRRLGNLGGCVLSNQKRSRR